MLCSGTQSTRHQFSLGTQQQYNLALKCHFLIAFFPSFISCNQPHDALCSLASSLLSCWYCNSELLLFTESQNHQDWKRPPRPSNSTVNPAPPKSLLNHFLYKQTSQVLRIGWGQILHAYSSFCLVLFLCLGSSSSSGRSEEMLPLLDLCRSLLLTFVFFHKFSYLSSTSCLPFTDFLCSLEYTGI